MNRSSLVRRGLTVTLLLLCSAARGEGRFTLPLPSPDLPDGVLTVKVVGQDLRDLTVNQPVELLRIEGTRELLLSTVATGKDGRARFDKIEPGRQYLVRVKIGGQEIRSAPLAGPTSGGIRLLLSLGGEMKMGGGLPPGHPPPGQDAPTGQDLPAGHPVLPRPDPQGQSGTAKVEPDTALEPNQVKVVVLRGAARTPLAGAQVQLVASASTKMGPAALKPTALKLTDARGETLASLTSDHDMIRVQHDGLTYSSAALSRGTKHGVRVVFQVYNRTADLKRLVMGPGSQWVCQVGEGVLRFMQVVQLENKGDAIFDPGKEGLVIPLPSGARNVELPTEAAGVVLLDEDQRTVRLVTPLPPGGLPLRIFFEIPFDSSELELQQRLPLRLAKSALVLVNAGDRVRISGPGVDTRGYTQAERGTVHAIAPLQAGGQLEITVANLPHRDRRLLLVVLALAGLVGLWAVGGALGAGPRVSRRQARREQLLQQLVQMHRSKKRQGQAARRAELTQELEQVWEDL